MPSTNSLAIVAPAGSGKTRTLINYAVAKPSRQVLIITYTNENLSQIDSRLRAHPDEGSTNVTTMTLFEFLLRECVKPFQFVKTNRPNLIRSIYTEKRPLSANFGGVEDFMRYFLTSHYDVYSDYLSQAAVEVNKASSGEVIKRLELLWDEIYVDEAQDMNGYDLELIDLILASRIRLVLVCDPRQAVYRSNKQAKNSKYAFSEFVTWIEDRPSLQRQDITSCYRSVQSICDFADGLYPGLPHTQSMRAVPKNGHSGVYLVRHSDIEEYCATYRPQELRWDRSNKDAGPEAINMRGSKGLEFKDVLIHPTEPMMKHLEAGADLKESSRAALYVASTRAENSVAIVTKKKTSKTQLPIWEPKKDQAPDIFDFLQDPKVY